jgi:hypothetical protein
MAILSRLLLMVKVRVANDSALQVLQGGTPATRNGYIYLIYNIHIWVYSCITYAQEATTCNQRRVVGRPLHTIYIPRMCFRDAFVVCACFCFSFYGALTPPQSYTTAAHTYIMKK